MPKYSDADRRMAKAYGVTPEGLAAEIRRSEARAAQRANELARQRERAAAAAARSAKKK